MFRETVSWFQTKRESQIKLKVTPLTEIVVIFIGAVSTVVHLVTEAPSRNALEVVTAVPGQLGTGDLLAD